MSKQRMNVQTIAEVLVEELSKMETTAKRIETASNRPINVDTKELKQLLSQQEGLLDQQTKLFRDHLYTPRWVVQSLAVLIATLTLFTAIAVGVSIHYRSKYQTEHETAVYWYDQYQKINPQKSN